MLTLVPSKDMETIAVEIEGHVTEDDLTKLDKVIQEKFSEKGEFNLYAILYHFERASFKALLEEMKIDVKRWSQYNKLAVISDDKKIEKLVEASDYLPSIKTKHFDITQMEAAWEWISE
ncbi:STAS/SEC14 domain-containing protein [Planococcus sp. MERTA32b]|nr:STAS/SEC14 domain-containing protein [Planococcus sp. MER TA 32b]